MILGIVIGSVVITLGLIYGEKIIKFVNKLKELDKNVAERIQQAMIKEELPEGYTTTAYAEITTATASGQMLQTFKFGSLDNKSVIKGIEHLMALNLEYEMEMKKNETTRKE